MINTPGYHACSGSISDWTIGRWCDEANKLQMVRAFGAQYVAQNNVDSVSPNAMVNTSSAMVNTSSTMVNTSSARSEYSSC